MDGISLIIFKTTGRGARGRMKQLTRQLRSQRIRFCEPAISDDQSTAVLFACHDSKQLIAELRMRG
jgi:hypothetical protein